MTCYISSHLS